jgi:hypothetical protein
LKYQFDVLNNLYLKFHMNLNYFRRIIHKVDLHSNRFFLYFFQINYFVKLNILMNFNTLKNITYKSKEKILIFFLKNHKHSFIFALTEYN